MFSHRLPLRPLEDALETLSRFRLTTLEPHQRDTVTALAHGLEATIIDTFLPTDLRCRDSVILTASSPIMDHFLPDSAIRCRLPEKEASIFFARAAPDLIDAARCKGLAGGPGIEALFQRLSRQGSPMEDSLAGGPGPFNAAHIRSVLMQMAHQNLWETSIRNPIWTRDFVSAIGTDANTALACLDAQIAAFPDAMGEALEHVMVGGDISMTALFLARGAHSPLLDKPWSDISLFTEGSANHMKRLHAIMQAGHGRLQMRQINCDRLVRSLARAQQGRGSGILSPDFQLTRDPFFPK